MTEIQGKPILVRVSARFELARVRVIGSRLYFEFKSRDMSHDHDYTFGTKRPQDIHLRKILSFNSWYPSEEIWQNKHIFFSHICEIKNKTD